MKPGSPATPTIPRTLAAIAEKAGVCRMTVSLALRHQPGVSRRTRERIISIAKAIGYRTNPLVSAYQAHIRARRAPSYQANIAWINDHPDPKFWHWLPMHGYLAGAEQRADELGFKLERFHLPAYGDTPAKARVGLQRVLQNRGIHGVILPWLFSIEHADADWSDFSVAMIGRNVGYGGRAREALPVFHHVNPDNYYNTGLALDRLREMGRTRVGLALSDMNDGLAGSLQRARYFVYQNEVPLDQRVPVFLAPELTSAATRRDVAEWCSRHQLTAVMLYDETLMESLPFPRQRLPLGVQLNRATQNGVFGVDTRHAEISAACVDLVVGQLYQNERGRPGAVKEVLVKGVWCVPAAPRARTGRGGGARVTRKTRQAAMEPASA